MAADTINQGASDPVSEALEKSSLEEIESLLTAVNSFA
jgi:hypothetical protein